MSKFKPQDGEHPKSAIHRYIAQFPNNPDVNFSIIDVVYSHDFQKNKNIYSAKIFYTINGQSNAYTSSFYSTKKEAEKEAYDHALKLLIFYLDKNETISTRVDSNPSNTNVQIVFVDELLQSYKINRIEPTGDHTDLSGKTIVMVDLENISKYEDIYHLTQFIKKCENIIMIKVAGFCSTVKSSADIIVRSNRKDAVDHYISYYIGMLEYLPQPPKKIYIISRDKFGSCLQDFCNNVVHSSDVDDFCSMFDQMH